MAVGDREGARPRAPRDEAIPSHAGIFRPTSRRANIPLEDEDDDEDEYEGVARRWESGATAANFPSHRAKWYAIR